VYSYIFDTLEETIEKHQIKTSKDGQSHIGDGEFLSFLQFIRMCLRFHPGNRLTPRQARQHPLVAGKPYDAHWTPPTDIRPPVVAASAPATLSGVVPGFSGMRQASGAPLPPRVNRGPHGDSPDRPLVASVVSPPTDKPLLSRSPARHSFFQPFTDAPPTDPTSSRVFGSG
jgi:hypothetical protein